MLSLDAQLYSKNSQRLRRKGNNSPSQKYTYPFGGPAVPEYCPTLEHFIVDLPMSVHGKNTNSCCDRSLLSAEKNRTSLSQIQLILELFEVKKPSFSHVRSLHCCHAVLKIIKRKSLYLINHNRQPKNSTKFTFLKHQAIYYTVRFVPHKKVRKVCTVRKTKKLYFPIPWLPFKIIR